ncbi:MAG: hypothetical protein GTO29_08315 [Candidatus Latescibacteria bacterium]|nr:hypothetical protein [Candidatus Latescibacterota bacterium]NIO56166.1 hypothetical protein [Candidatus Latescibacterota bacterium]
MQERVSQSIVDALKLELSPEEERRITEGPIDNVHAYESYLRAGQKIMLFTEEGLKRALQHLQRAMDIVGENAFSMQVLVMHIGAMSISESKLPRYIFRGLRLTQRRCSSWNPNPPAGTCCKG